MKKHLNILPQTFQTILPEPLVHEVLKCKTDAQVRQVGIEWAVFQSKDLLKNKVADIHYFTMGKSDNIIEIVKKVF